MLGMTMEYRHIPMTVRSSLLPVTSKVYRQNDSSSSLVPFLSWQNFIPLIFAQAAWSHCPETTDQISPVPQAIVSGSSGSTGITRWCRPLDSGQLSTTPHSRRNPVQLADLLTDTFNSFLTQKVMPACSLATSTISVPKLTVISAKR